MNDLKSNKCCSTKFFEQCRTLFSSSTCSTQIHRKIKSLHHQKKKRKLQVNYMFISKRFQSQQFREDLEKVLLFFFFSLKTYVIENLERKFLFINHLQSKGSPQEFWDTYLSSYLTVHCNNILYCGLKMCCCVVALQEISRFWSLMLDFLKNRDK